MSHTRTSDEELLERADAAITMSNEDNQHMAFETRRLLLELSQACSLLVIARNTQGSVSKLKGKMQKASRS